jgi:acyl-coenzyme A thioesterase PaaI-like protein
VSNGASDDVAPLPPEELDAAAAMRRLGHALIGHDVSPALSAEVAEVVTALAERVEAAPDRTKKQAFTRYSGQQRIEYFVRHGSWPPPPPDGGEVTFDALSFVGGVLSPFSAGARYSRDGEQAVGRVTLQPGHEGPPERAHGGIVAAVFDEVMGAVFRVRADGSAFTGSLTVRFEAPAPVGQLLEFRAWLASTEGRKHTVEGTATGPDGRFASAVATFIEMSPEHLAQALAVDDR